MGNSYYDVLAKSEKQMKLMKRHDGLQYLFQSMLEGVSYVERKILPDIHGHHPMGDAIRFNVTLLLW